MEMAVGKLLPTQEPDFSGEWDFETPATIGQTRRLTRGLR